MTPRVVKIKYADAPREGRKMPTVKTSEGERFEVLQELFGLFQPGRSYRIEWSERQFNGRTYRTITRCNLAEEAAPAANNNKAALTSAAPAAAGEEAFVARLLAASIAACAVGHSAEALIAEARMLRAVYRATFPA